MIELLLTMRYLIENINKLIPRLVEADTIDSIFKLTFKQVLNLSNIKTGMLICNLDNKLSIIQSSNIDNNLKINKGDNVYEILRKPGISIKKREVYIKNEFLKNIKFKFALFFPLIYHKESIGIIILFTDKRPSFTKDIISLYNIFTAIASAAIKKTQLHQEVKSALEMRDRFISLASHELRTPLTSMSGYAQLLYRKLANKGTVESKWIEELYFETQRLTQLIKELLDINRIKQGQLEFILREIDLAEVVDKALERFRLTHKDNKIIVLNKINVKKSVMIGDYNKLLQMVSALLSNASKFSPFRSKILIELENNKRYLILRVIDEGKGIPKKEISKIFDGFYKIGTEEKEGLGVGLLLAQHIIESHKGKIEISSGKKSGTTIEVQLPLLKM